MSYETFQCERHGTSVAIVTPAQAAELGITFGCPACTAELSGRDPATMTGDERASELEDWLNRNLTVAFTDLHQRIEALVGRPVWTHEMASPDHLIQEARSGQHPVDLEAHVIGSLDQLAGNKPMDEQELEEIRALRDADTLHMLPPEALIASIKYLAEKVLELAHPDGDA